LSSARSLRFARLPWGYLISPSRHQRFESTHWQSSQLLPTFRPRRFSRPRRFTPRCALRACFIPQPRPRFTPQGFPPAASPLGFHPSVPSCRFCLSPIGSKLPGPAPGPRLQGFDSDYWSVVAIRWFRPDSPRSPLEFSLPQVFVRTPCRRPRAVSAHDLFRRHLTVTPATGLQRINRCSAFASVP
jgi:hypothetical protein